jgi:uncharacterized protein (TIGR01244 family)
MIPRSAVLAAGLGAAAPVLAGVPEALDPDRIPFYRLLQPDLAVGGQPAPETLKQLKELGFRTVINLRTEKEGALDERGVIEAQGLRYVWIPVTPETFNLADAEAARKMIEDPTAGPVLLHCASSNRVGGVWSVIQSLRGKTASEAEAAGREAGLRSPQMIDAVRRVLGVSAPTAAPAPNP